MSIGRVLSMGVLFVGWLSGGIAALAGGPWDKLLTTSRVEADPQKSYDLAERNGPWMIMACSFSGENARDQAKSLALELRKRYKLPAYVYEKKFDLGRDLHGRGVDEFGRPKRMAYLRGASEVNEIAVLVGDYPAVDDPEAQETLLKLKYCEPDCLTLKEGRSTSQNLAGFRRIQAAVLSGDNPKKKKGPMGHAFVTTNPLLSADYFVPQGLDPLVVKANEGVEHSLLDCPGKYTVQVAHFTGRVYIKQNEIAAIEKGKEIDSQLAKAAYLAHKLTEALRWKGYEAYEFHDRYASVVTVGSFESVGPTDARGTIHLDPRISRIIDLFKAEQKLLPGKASPEMVPKTLVDIPFDVQPIPVHVPRRSVAAALSQNSSTAR